MVTSLGNDVETSWRNLIAGESGAGEITQFDHDGYPVHFACELKDFDPTDWVDHKSARRMDRFAQMILAAARQAEAGLGHRHRGRPERVGASIATGIGGLHSFQDCYDVLSRAARTASARSRSRASSRTWARAGSRSSSARRGR